LYCNAFLGDGVPPKVTAGDGAGDARDGG
jgi:hypothetical protein